MPKLEKSPSARPRNVPPAPPQPIPDDTEVLSDHAIRAIEEGRTDHAAGRTFTMAEIKQELGIDS